MTVRVAALTSGSRTPSSRFRIRQHIGPLAAHGVRVREFRPVFNTEADEWLRLVRPKGVRVRQFPPAYPVYLALLGLRLAARVPGLIGSWRYDVTWLERGLCDGWPTLEGRLGKPLVLDVDDAVWLAEPFGERQMRRAAERADVVLVCNAYLAEWFARFCGRIETVPTAVDGDRFFPIDKRGAEPFVVGWIGTSSNFPYLYAIGNALAAFLRHAADARLRVVADRPPSELDVPADRIEFVPWSEAGEARAVQEMDVGIMPLADDPWTRGKCAFKVIQYMACGLPVVASPVGMNPEVLGTDGAGLHPGSESEWTDALVHLYEHRSEARDMGARGRARFLERYSRAAVTGQLARIFSAFG